MVKLSPARSAAAIGAAATVVAAAGASSTGPFSSSFSSSSSSSSSLLERQLHQRLVREALLPMMRDAASDADADAASEIRREERGRGLEEERRGREAMRRRAQGDVVADEVNNDTGEEEVEDDENEDGDNCPGTPFLWKIIDDSTGTHVGFGLGTMHLAADVVTTQGAYASILAAIEDSCDVYGELNLHDADVMAQIAECAASTTQNAATVADIPDEQLKADIAAKMSEVGTLISPDDPDLAALYASRLLTLPLLDVLNIILYANTPEYAEGYLQMLYSGGEGAVALDSHLMSLGRPANGLEEVSTQCDLLSALYPSAEEIRDATAFDEYYSQGLRDSLDEDLSEEISLYRCGDVDKFVEAVAAGMPVDEDMNDALLGDRNEQMATRMDEILKANVDGGQRIMFAVGNAHWLNGGDKSLASLLEGYGYTLEHVPEWHGEMLENHSNEHCEVLFHPEMGLFVPVPEGASASGGEDLPWGDVTTEPTHGVVKDTYFTTTAVPLEEDEGEEGVDGDSDGGEGGTGGLVLVEEEDPQTTAATMTPPGTDDGDPLGGTDAPDAAGTTPPSSGGSAALGARTWPMMAVFLACGLMVVSLGIGA